MNVTDKKYFNQYNERIGKEIKNLINDFDFSDDNGSFDYLTKASAVYSSNIEGNTIDLNSFMNYQMNKKKTTKGKEIEEIEDLIDAYRFAQQNSLNENNLLNCHKILSESFLIKSKRGKYRDEKIGVFGNAGLTYLAVEPEFVEKEMKDFFKGIEILLNQKLTEAETFYFASIIHLKFAHIHPFSDGNGRAARLIEKWFLTEQLGKEFWKIPSEEYYKNNQQQYYRNINLGVNFYELKYDDCVDFLVMLPESFKNKSKK